MLAGFAGRRGAFITMAWLHLLPDFLVFPVVVLPFAAAVAAAPHLRHRFFPRTTPPPLNSEYMDAFIALASSAAVLLTFSLVQAESVLRHVEDQVAKEAATLNDLDRTLTRYGDAKITALRPLLMSYGNLLVTGEWPLLADGHRSHEADTAYAQVSKHLRQIEPESHRQQIMFAEALKQIDDLSDLRDERIDAAQVTLPGIYWFTTLMMLGLMVVVAARNEPNRDRAWITTTVAVAIGLLASLVIIFDAPFQGSGSISAHPFAEAMDQMRERS